MGMLTRTEMLAAIAAGGSVMLPGGVVIYSAAQVPSQAALDAGQYDAYSDQAYQASLLASRMARPNTRRIGSIKANGSTGFTGDGDVGVVVGTPTADAATAAIPWAMVKLTSGAVSGNQGAVSGPANYWWGGKPLFQGLFTTGASIAVQRIWLGLANTAWATLLATDTPAASALSGAAFRYSTALGDATWKCVTFDGASQTVVDSGVAVATTAGKRFEISDNGSVTTFKIDGQTVATISTTRPASTVAMRQGGGRADARSGRQDLQRRVAVRGDRLRSPARQNFLARRQGAAAVGIAFGFAVNVSAALAAVRKARQDLSAQYPEKMRQGFIEAGRVYLAGQRKDYLRNSRGGGDWPDLAESTLKQKRRQGTDRGIMRRSDRLLDSLEPGNPDNILVPLAKGVKAGSKVPYGKFHAKRFRRRPARPPLKRPDAELKRQMKVPIVKAVGLQAREWNKAKVSAGTPRTR